jgi:hypothetical protein
MGKRRWAILAVTVTLAAACSAGPSKPLFTQSQGPQKDLAADLTGLGDPYYPKYGNSGYDVQRYLLKVRYEPSSGRLTGSETVTAQATAPLTKFDLDFHGMTVDSIQIDGQKAGFTRDADELVITPSQAIAKDAKFTLQIEYNGVPGRLTIRPWVRPGSSRRKRRDRHGEPESATTWFPVNDHPRDKALYDIELTIPDGLSGLSNGVLTGKSTKDGQTTWSWQVNQPMAPYLATLIIGNYRVQEGTCEGKPMITGWRAPFRRRSSMVTSPARAKSSVPQPAVRPVPVRRLRRHRHRRRPDRVRLGDADAACVFGAVLARQLQHRRLGA